MYVIFFGGEGEGEVALTPELYTPLLDGAPQLPGKTPKQYQIIPASLYFTCLSLPDNIPEECHPTSLNRQYDKKLQGNYI